MDLSGLALDLADVPEPPPEPRGNGRADRR
jgi:hypothetical protein